MALTVACGPLDDLERQRCGLGERCAEDLGALIPYEGRGVRVLRQFGVPRVTSIRREEPVVGLVRRQPGVPLLRRIHRSRMPGVIVIPRSRRDSMRRQGHTSLGGT